MTIYAASGCDCRVDVGFGGKRPGRCPHGHRFLTEHQLGRSVGSDATAKTGDGRRPHGAASSTRRPMRRSEPKRDWSLARAKCEQCDGTFQPDHEGHRFCSVDCANDAQRTGRQGKEVICEQCGEPFQAMQEHAGYQRKYCSRQCAGAARSKTATLKCKFCGDEFTVKASKVKDGRKYCSRACMNADPDRKTGPGKAAADEMSKTRRGRGNPAFKHGEFGNRARRSKFSLKLKGERHCRVCGRGTELHLHHMVPRSKAVAGRDEIRNGMPLCSSCHMSWHRRGLVIYRDLMTEDEWRCVSSLATPGWLDERYPDRGLPFRDPDIEKVFE